MDAMSPTRFFKFFSALLTPVESPSAELRQQASGSQWPDAPGGVARECAAEPERRADDGAAVAGNGRGRPREARA